MISDKEYLIKFGKHLKAMREAKGISGAELARRLFMEKSNLYRLERGDTNPTLITIRKICTALEITPEEFFSEEFD